MVCHASCCEGHLGKPDSRLRRCLDAPGATWLNACRPRSVPALSTLPLGTPLREHASRPPWGACWGRVEHNKSDARFITFTPTLHSAKGAASGGYKRFATRAAVERNAKTHHEKCLQIARKSHSRRASAPKAQAQNDKTRPPTCGALRKPCHVLPPFESRRAHNMMLRGVAKPAAAALSWVMPCYACARPSINATTPAQRGALLRRPAPQSNTQQNAHKKANHASRPARARPIRQKRTMADRCLNGSCRIRNKVSANLGTIFKAPKRPRETTQHVRPRKPEADMAQPDRRKKAESARQRLKCGG